MQNVVMEKTLTPIHGLPNGPPLKWTTPKNNVLSEYYLKL